MELSGYDLHVHGLGLFYLLPEFQVADYGQATPLTGYQLTSAATLNQLATAAALAAATGNLTPQQPQPQLQPQPQPQPQQPTPIGQIPQQQTAWSVQGASESFIPGAISNQTLEHLTESTMRPYRAIRGSGDLRQQYPGSV